MTLDKDQLFLLIKGFDMRAKNETQEES